MAGTVAAAVARASSAREQLVRSEAESLPRAIEIERMAQDSYSSGQTNFAALLQTLQLTSDVRRRTLEAGAEYQRALADLERDRRRSMKELSSHRHAFPLAIVLLQTLGEKIETDRR